jgi:hypothetical protein
MRLIRVPTALLLILIGATSCASPNATSLAQAQFTAPVDGSAVQQCAVFTGTARLPKDSTLVLGMQNLDNGDPNHYFNAVNDYDDADALPGWTGYQWFGGQNTSVGQRYRVELLIVDLASVQTALASAKQVGWHATQDPAQSVLAAHLTVHRVAGAGPAACS